jgi:hypothetical protein
MARNSDQLFEAENSGGLLSGLLAEEDDFDRFTLWRLGSWGAISVAAVVVALYANQSSMGLRHEQLAAAEFARQTQQIQLLAKESQGEARRLASAIDTLNGDRDRLYSRVTVLEQGLDSVTGSIAKQKSAAAPAAPPAPSSSPLAAAPAETSAPVVAQNPSPAPVAAPVTTTATAKSPPASEKAPPAAEKAAPAAEKPPAVAAVAEPAPATVASVPQPTPDTPPPTPAVPLMSSKSMMAPPDPAAGKLIEPSLPPKTFTAAPIPDVVASTSPIEDADTDASETPPPKLAVRQTEFAVDVGSANSITGLRMLWRGLLKSNPALGALRPVLAVKEGRGGFGMQLRLVAGPLQDAAAAAKLCAGLIESKRACETTVFDGQRLAMNGDEPPVTAKPAPRRRFAPRHAAAVVEEPKKPEPSTLSRIFGSR